MGPDGKLRVMGANWILWRTIVSVIIILQQIQALTSKKSIRSLTGVEGQTLYFRCEYPNHLQSNAKYLSSSGSSEPLVQTEKQNIWEKNGRFSLFDNTTGTEAFIHIRIKNLVPEDSGTYTCGVDISKNPDDISYVILNVSRAKPPENLTHFMTAMPIFPSELTVNKLHMPLFLTAVMCVAAIMFVCLFTLCLMWAVKVQRPDPVRNREPSSDYETMMPGVGTEPELRCTSFSRDGDDLSPAPPPPDLCSHFTSKQRESAVTLGLGEYVDVDALAHICPYQHLDLGQLEDHVYHSLNGNSSPKAGHLRNKQQVNC